MNDFRSITVQSGKKSVEIINSAGFKMIGKGTQGAVFKLNDDRCVKIFAKESKCKHETKALKAAQASQIVPKVYEAGPKYIIMEFIKGDTLQDNLESQRSIPESLVKQLLYVFKEMKKIGFTRIDAKTRHIIINQEGAVKVIDHVNSLKSKHPIPKRFFAELANLNLLDSFLKQVKALDPEQYLEWYEASNKNKMLS